MSDPTPDERREKTPSGLLGRMAALFGRSHAAAPEEVPSQEPVSDPAQAAPTAPPRFESALLKLYVLWKGAPPADPDACLLLEGDFPTPLQQRALARFEREAKGLLPRPPKPVEEGAGPEEALPAPVDATYSLWVSEDKLSAFLLLFPPLCGGADITRADVNAALAGAGVTFGVDQALLDRLSDEKCYLKLAMAAAGELPVDGVDGRVEDRFPREKEIVYTEQADGSVNFKELNLLDHVSAGDVICDIFPAVPPADGHNVEGGVIPGRVGRPPEVPMGKHTRLSEDQSALLSEIDGQVSFSGGKFNVESVLTVPGDVDGSTGNLDVVGSVIIYGDVLEGYEVRATAEITVRGIAEGCVLTAGAGVQLYRGMNGNQRGIISAAGDVSAKFLENCSVTAGGSVRSQSIINCTVISDCKVIADLGRGVLIGGTVTACQGVEARAIGTNSHRATNIVVGSTPDFLQKHTEAAAVVEDMARELESLERNVSYLGSLPQLSPAQSAKLNQCKLRRSVLRIHHAKHARELEEMERRLAGMAACYVKAGTLYPGVKVTIGLETRSFNAVEHLCRVYSGPDGITVGAG